MNNNALGNAIKDARLELGLSKKDLASLAGVSQTQICTIEAGKSKPFVSTLVAINSVLKCDLNEVLMESGYSKKKIERINSANYYLLKSYRKMTNF